MGRSAVATFLRSSWETYRIEERMRWMTQVCTIALGQAASIASGSPPSPSQQTNRTSLMPRLRSSVSTPIQKRAPSAAASQIPSTCLYPSMSTPMARWAALLSTVPPSLSHDPRLKGAITIPGDAEPDRPGRRGHGLVITAITGIARAVSGRVALHISQVIIELGAQRPLQHRPGQLIQKPARAVQGHPGLLGVGQHPVDRLRADQVRQPLGRYLLRAGHDGLVRALVRQALRDDLHHCRLLVCVHDE